jgi:hypothetical protein
LIEQLGSYSPNDVIFLLKNVDGLVTELTIEEREKALQSGKSYGAVIPKEKLPTDEYTKLFAYSLERYAKDIARYSAIVAQQIIAKKSPNNLVLVSLARAGTPIGILIKRFLDQKYEVTIPHYAVSIISGVGLDLNAIRYILTHHPHANIQFVDGWTGKGFVSSILQNACDRLRLENGICLDPSLAVLADTGHCTTIYGTREDFLIPNSCLNATVSGLLSRTVYDPSIIGENEFHGAKFFTSFLPHDISNTYVDEISKHFDDAEPFFESAPPTWQGMKSCERIMKDFGITNHDLLKPGVNETTRMMLIRVPWKILVSDANSANLEHIYLLAKEKNVPIEVYPHMIYSCCGLIQPVQISS